MASGNTLCVFTPQAGLPPASNYATLDLRNVAHLVLDFDASTEEAAYFEGVLPRHYAGGGITLRLCWMATSATSGNVVWGACFERHDDEATDLDADSFASEQTATSAAPATSGAVQYVDIAFTDGAQLDSLATGEHFRIKIARKAADGSDTISGDAELLSVELRET